MKNVKVIYANAAPCSVSEIRKSHAVTERYDDQTGSRYFEFELPRDQALLFAAARPDSVRLEEVAA